MPKKHRYTAKEHRQVEHIEASEERRGVSTDEAKSIAYATVNKRSPARHRFTAKERREAAHIEASEEKRGKPEAQAKRIGFATVNKRRS